MTFDQSYCSGSRCPKREVCVHFVGHVKEWCEANPNECLDKRIDVFDRSPAEGGICHLFAYVPGESPMEVMIDEVSQYWLEKTIEDIQRPSLFDRLVSEERANRVYGPGEVVYLRKEAAECVKEIDDFMENISKWRPSL